MKNCGADWELAQLEYWGKPVASFCQRGILEAKLPVARTSPPPRSSEWHLQAYWYKFVTPVRGHRGSLEDVQVLSQEDINKMLQVEKEERRCSRKSTGLGLWRCGSKGLFCHWLLGLTFCLFPLLLYKRDRLEDVWGHSHNTDGRTLSPNLSPIRSLSPFQATSCINNSTFTAYLL